MRACCGLLILLVAGSAARAGEPARVRLELEATLSAGSERVRSLAWTPDGNRLAAGCSDRTMRIFSTRISSKDISPPGAAEPVASKTLPRYG